MNRFDPYVPVGSYYECLGCGFRATAAHTPGSCPRCGGPVKNMGIAQE
ncbi:rubrerythrin-like domain-containing protein [Natrononativus amylolyticus]|nr:rubrerythrin-like domain-containing protein [Natrononativus amylolyticus]